MKNSQNAQPIQFVPKTLEDPRAPSKTEGKVFAFMFGCAIGMFTASGLILLIALGIAGVFR